MSHLDDLLNSVPDGSLQHVLVGAFWTAVVVESEGERRCGLASTLRTDEHHHGGGPAVGDAGRLMDRTARQLAELARSDSSMEAALGIATLNALLPPLEEAWVDVNAEQVIARHGAGKGVVVVGHFPFIPALREQVGQLWVLELDPRGADLPAAAAPEVIPQADVLAITGTSLINHTFAGLMALRRSDAIVLLLGPSTPLSPILFDHGVHLISGAVVEYIPAVLRAVGQGANFRQVRRHGVRLVTMQKA
jgi:uncharacterized protein (DUF4213/DUF364 family)